jgi:hypothetical protein
MSLQSVIRQMGELVSHLGELIEHAEKHSAPPHMKGYHFEKQFRAHCRQRGMTVSNKTMSSHVDLLVNGKRVQCKNLTPNAAGQVFLQPGQSTYYMPEDFDVLAMSCCDCLYLVPMQALPVTGGHVCIQVKPAALGEWIDRWDVLGDFVFTDKQQTLFGEEEALDGR